MSDRVGQPPLGDVTLGWAIACSRAGASHRRGGTLCQDDCALKAGCVAAQTYLVAAVADGHGDERHDLSHLGAALAVQVAVSELVALHAHFGTGKPVGQLKNSFKQDFPRHLLRGWREAVKEKEKDRLQRETGDAPNREPAEGDEVFARYGTTLLAALVTHDVLLLSQIGDGVILMVRPGGEVECPPPPGGEEVGTVTDSLCSPEAHQRCRIATLERAEGGVLLLATDGVTNAFRDDEQLRVFARSIRDRVREYGLVQVASSLPAWLDHYSNQASGDDVTLAVLEVLPVPAAPAPASPAEGEGHAPGAAGSAAPA